MLGETDRAIAHFERAVDAARESDDEENLQAYLINLGVAKMQKVQCDLETSM